MRSTAKTRKVPTNEPDGESMHRDTKLYRGTCIYGFIIENLEVKKVIKVEPELFIVPPEAEWLMTIDSGELRSVGISSIFERYIAGDQEDHEATLNWRPYVLRAFFDTQLLIAESGGKAAHDFRVFWVGHKGSIEARCTTNKGILPKALIEEMHEAFRRS